MTRVVVHDRRVVNNGVLRCAILGGGFGIEHLPEISAPNAALDDAFDIAGPQRVRPFRWRVPWPGGRRVGFRGDRGGGSGKEEKGNQAGFHRLRQTKRAVETGRATKSKYLRIRLDRGSPYPGSVRRSKQGFGRARLCRALRLRQ